MVATPAARTPTVSRCGRSAGACAPQLPKTPVWAYDDDFGLSGQAGWFRHGHRGPDRNPVQVSYAHRLPGLPVLDSGRHPAHAAGPPVPMMAHLHGGFVAAADDGNPTVTPDGFGPGETRTVVYPNQAPQQSARLMWFHDHAMGATQLTTCSCNWPAPTSCATGTTPAPSPTRSAFQGGRARDPTGASRTGSSTRMALPATRSAPSPASPGSASARGPHAGQRQGLAVPGGRAAAVPVPGAQRVQRAHRGLSMGGAPMWQIGAEGGLWDRPVRMDRLVLTPAERADVIISSFRRLRGPRSPCATRRRPRQCDPALAAADR